MSFLRTGVCRTSTEVDLKLSQVYLVTSAAWASESTDELKIVEGQRYYRVLESKSPDSG